MGHPNPHGRRAGADSKPDRQVPRDRRQRVGGQRGCRRSLQGRQWQDRHGGAPPWHFKDKRCISGHHFPDTFYTLASIKKTWYENIHIIWILFWIYIKVIKKKYLFIIWIYCFQFFEDVGRFLDTRETSSSWNSSGWGHCFCYKHRQVFYLLRLLHHKHHEVLYLLHHPHHQEMQWWLIINVRKTRCASCGQALLRAGCRSRLWLVSTGGRSCGGLKCGHGVLWWF